jgi:4-amino-4-deoxy-L-arabinose transferase-like glycosyltransferase
MERQYQKTYFLMITILLAFALFNLFYRLGNFPIYSWDEARHGVSAFEMLKNHNFIVNTYRGKPDYWNLKPVLSFWAIMVGYKLVGFNALGLRLCSAIFAMVTIIIVTRFTYKRYGKVASVVTMLAIITSTQYITNHSARTGDADSLFVCLFTIAILSLLKMDQNRRWLYVSGLGFALAFLTKSWHAGNIAVIIILYLLLTGKFKKLTVKNWILLVVSMSLPVLIWATIRYQYDGITFFKGMVMYDLLHRSSAPIEGHIGGPGYYFHIIAIFFKYWILVLGLLCLFFFVKRKFSWKQFIPVLKNDDVIGLVLWALIPFLLFTIAKTKIRWYILPMYPSLAIIIGVLASKYLQNGKWATRTIVSAVILFVSFFYEYNIISYLNHPMHDYKQSLIDKVAEQSAAKNDRLFIYHPAGSAYWSQSDVLSAELAADFKVQNGGMNAFLKKNKALLLVPKKWYSQPMLETDHLRIVSSNKWGYVVEKNGMGKRMT